MEWKIFKTVVFVIVIFGCNILHAQKYRALYSMQFKEDSTTTDLTKKEMLLDIDGSNSRFYSYQLFKSDSAFISNEKAGREALRKSMDYEFMAIKNKDAGQLSTFYRLLVDVYEMKEAIPILAWKISPDTKIISNYKCQKATLDYKKRKWEAWFATELPLSDGPSIFSGLPGLIISMYDVSGSYRFDLESLKKHEENIYTVNNFSLQTIPVTRKQLHKLHLDNYNDPYKEIKAGKIKAKFVGQDGKEITPNFNELAKNKQIIIKKNNNPIELSDAVKYPD